MSEAEGADLLESLGKTTVAVLVAVLVAASTTDELGFVITLPTRPKSATSLGVAVVAQIATGVEVEFNKLPIVFAGLLLVD